jgi:addiction module RelB/DinJ family antitoxin
MIYDFFATREKLSDCTQAFMDILTKVCVCIIFVIDLYMGGMKMSQTNLIQVRVDAELKRQAEELFADLGIDAPSAIRLFLKQAVSKNGIPFPITRPEKELKKFTGVTPSMRNPFHVGENYRKYSKEELHER